MRLSKVFSMLKLFSGIALVSGALVLTASMNVKAAVESEDNNSMAAANNISVNEAVSGNLSSSKDKDYYKFTIGDKGCAVLSLSFWHDDCEERTGYLSDTVWRVTLLDSQGKKLVVDPKSVISQYGSYFNMIVPGGNATTHTRVLYDLKKGTYYAMVETDGSEGIEVDYSLTVNVIEPGVLPNKIPGLDCKWYTVNGKSYWYEESIRQGTYDDPQGVMGDGTVRGREIYDSNSRGWYWLDACYDGAKAVGKEVWMPYIYQDEANWDEITLRNIANESDRGMEECVLNAMLNHTGKWVRYDENGKMLKGWVTIEGKLATLYPSQAGNKYYYDTRTGLMARGYVTIKGVDHYFDEITGVMQW